MLSERSGVGSWGTPCSGIKWQGTRRLWVTFNTGLNLPWLILTKSCFQQLGLQEWTGRICSKLAFAVRRRYFIYNASAGANMRRRIFPSAEAEQREKEKGEVVVPTLLTCPMADCNRDLLSTWDFILQIAIACLLFGKETRPFQTGKLREQFLVSWDGYSGCHFW